MNIVDQLSNPDSKSSCPFDRHSSNDIEFCLPPNGIADLNKRDDFEAKPQSSHRSAHLDSSDGIGYRSPCVSLQQHHGATSPAVQGRSVREFEEHTAALRKENFNLKLRLYFIEENIPALKSNGAEGCDTAMRELIEHKVEVEMLRRELEEKKVVLKDALQAIEDLEKLQKDTEMNYEAKFEDLKQKIQFLEMDHSADKSENTDFMNNILGRSDIVSDHVNNLQRIRELESLVKTGEETISELENKVAFLDGILSKRDQSIKELEDKMKSLEYRNAELEEDLDEMKKDNASCEAACCPSNEYSSNKYLEKCLIDARNQQESINRLQEHLSLRAQNSERLLERFRELEKCIDRMREERKSNSQKNQFLCGVIKKLRNQLKSMPKTAVQMIRSSEEIQRKVTVETIKRVTSSSAAKKSGSNGILEGTANNKINEMSPLSTDFNYNGIGIGDGDGVERFGGEAKTRGKSLSCTATPLIDDDDDDDDDEDDTEISISDIDADEINNIIGERKNFNGLYLNSSSTIKHTARRNAAAASNKCSKFRWVKETKHEQSDSSTLFITVQSQETSCKGDKFRATRKYKSSDSNSFQKWQYTWNCFYYPVAFLNFYLRIGQPGIIWLENFIEKVYKKSRRNGFVCTQERV